MWVLEIELGSPVRAVGDFNHWVIFTGPFYLLWDTVSHWGRGLLTQLGWLTNELQGTPGPGVNDTCHPNQLLRRCWGSELVLMVYGKYLTDRLTISSMPPLMFWMSDPNVCVCQSRGRISLSTILTGMLQQFLTPQQYVTDHLDIIHSFVLGSIFKSLSSGHVMLLINAVCVPACQWARCHGGIRRNKLSSREKFNSNMERWSRTLLGSLPKKLS